MKNGNIVEMAIAWEQGHGPSLESLLTELLTKASETEVALPINPLGNWTFDEIMKGFVNCSIHWLLKQSKLFPSSLMLFTDSEEYYGRAHTCIEDRLLEVLEGNIGSSIYLCKKQQHRIDFI